MFTLRIGTLLLTALVATSSLTAGEATFQSGPTRTPLLELFTSEGCSSCPPAEQWFSTLRQSKRLWKEVVPVSFHVDYWDGLGWPDPLASRAFTNRQRAYAASWRSDSVYTPGFVLNGAEWKERTLEAVPAPREEAGTLTAVAVGGVVTITYVPAKSWAPKKWRANAALLGLDVAINVKAGENGGRKLVHDFVALAHQSGSMTAGEAGFRSTLQVPADKIRHGQSALAAWVTEEGKSEPMQAVGGDL